MSSILYYARIKEDFLVEYKDKEGVPTVEKYSKGCWLKGTLEAFNTRELFWSGNTFFYPENFDQITPYSAKKTIETIKFAG